MTTPTPANIPLTWTVDSFSILGGFGTLALLLWLMYFIYRRAGSMFFLRDLIWRSFGGKTEFDNPDREVMRKELRELEHFRYEFNIPATSLQDADHAQRWITAHGFAPGDVGRVRSYVDWRDFSALKFATGKLAPWVTNTLFATLIVLLAGLAVVPPITNSKYLMVSLKNAPEAPSFYLSEADIKFRMWTDDYLTVEQCRSSKSLQPFIKPGLPEEKLDLICSFFMDPGYAEHVVKGVHEQRRIMLGFALVCMGLLALTVLKLARMERAQALYRQWQTLNR